MKKCKDCGLEKQNNDFYGIQGECKKCTQKRVQLNYRINIKHYIKYEKNRFKDKERKINVLKYQRIRRHKYPIKNKARQDVYKSLKKGILVKKPCEVCGYLKVEAHHEDYNKPLDVIWLCRKHHLEKEGKIPF